MRVAGLPDVRAFYESCDVTHFIRNMKKKHPIIIISLAICLCCFFPPAVEGRSFKVLVVMSYDESYPWTREIKEGIDRVLSSRHELRYFHMDTKKNLKQGSMKARAAFELYQRFHPDGVIAADDNAQSMFVLPYLKDKVPTPVMFCGVNREPEAYGYPASNVSGILERLHVRDTLDLAARLIPSAKTFSFMAMESPSEKAILKQIESEAGTCALRFVEGMRVRRLEEALSAAKSLSERCDILFMETMHGLPGKDGRLMTDKEVVPLLRRAFGKPLVGANRYHVENGVLCAVVKIGQEQGGTAATMLLRAMKGRPVSEIPLTRNRYGKGFVNRGVMRALGIKPRAEVLEHVGMLGAEE